MSGFVHVYTGDGKGKTTAALGMALRAAGAGWKVFIARFGSAVASSELSALDRFADLITVRHYGPGRKAAEESTTAAADDRAAQTEGLRRQHGIGAGNRRIRALRVW